MMIATAEALDQLLAEATRQTAKNAAFAEDTIRRYLAEMSEVSGNELAALGALQRAIVRAVFELQDAAIRFPRSVLEVASQLNHAFTQWSVFAIWPWPPGALTVPRGEEAPSDSPMASRDADTGIGEYVISALQFQPPLGVISSGLGESADDD